MIAELVGGPLDGRRIRVARGTSDYYIVVPEPTGDILKKAHYQASDDRSNGIVIFKFGGYE